MAYIDKNARYLFVCFLLLSFSCNKLEKSNYSFNMSTLRIGITADLGKKKSNSRYMPLFKYLSKEIGIPVEPHFAKTERDLFKLFETGNIDLAFFSGYGFVKAKLWHKAIPLIMSDVDAQHTSSFFIRGDMQAGKLSEYQGKRFGFGSKLSTADHWMPRFYLKEMSIIPENYFSNVLYSNSEKDAASKLRDREIDIGVLDSKIIKSMYQNGILQEKDIQIIWETPAFPDNVWAINPYYREPVRKKIREAFLKLSTDKKSHAKVLNGIGATRFLPATDDDFSSLIDTVQAS